MSPLLACRAGGGSSAEEVETTHREHWLPRSQSEAAICVRLQAQIPAPIALGGHERTHRCMQAYLLSSPLQHR